MWRAKAQTNVQGQHRGCLPDMFQHMGTRGQLLDSAEPGCGYTNLDPYWHSHRCHADFHSKRLDLPLTPEYRNARLRELAILAGAEKDPLVTGIELEEEVVGWRLLATEVTEPLWFLDTLPYLATEGSDEDEPVQLLDEGPWGNMERRQSHNKLVLINIPSFLQEASLPKIVYLDFWIVFGHVLLGIIFVEM